MKVDILHYSAAPIVGGVETVISRHANLMADAGNSVRILAGRGAQTDFRIPFVELPLVDSLHPDVLAVKTVLDQGIVPPEFEELSRRIQTELETNLNPDAILIAHNVCSLHKNLALTAALHRLLEESSRLRLVLWHHDLAWTSARYQNELYPGYPWNLLRTTWPGASQVVVSELRRQELATLLDISPDTIQVIPNGIDLNKFLALNPQTIELYTQLSLIEAEPLFILPVRITRRKNIELALRTLAFLTDSFSHPVLLVTGPLGAHNPDNANYFDELKNLQDELSLDGQVIFLAETSKNYLPDKVIADLYRVADALFLPSQEEGFGIPILEAGLIGIPIFCSDIPSLHVLAGNQAVYFSPQAEPSIVAQKISDHLEIDPTYMMRRRVRKHFTWDQIYQQQIAPLLDENDGSQ
jgi:glycosyltransferase involved in cell wall biosynthesis